MSSISMVKAQCSAILVIVVAMLVVPQMVKAMVAMVMMRTRSAFAFRVVAGGRVRQEFRVKVQHVQQDRERQQRRHDELELIDVSHM